jgi:hypothetical protein
MVASKHVAELVVNGVSMFRNKAPVVLPCRPAVPSYSAAPYGGAATIASTQWQRMPRRCGVRLDRGGGQNRARCACGGVV